MTSLNHWRAQSKCQSQKRLSHAFAFAADQPLPASDGLRRGLRQRCCRVHASANDWDRARRGALCRNCTVHRRRGGASLCGGRPPNFHKRRIQWRRESRPQAAEINPASVAIFCSFERVSRRIGSKGRRYTSSILPIIANTAFTGSGLDR